MKAVLESYKGIEYIQISNLPFNQRNEISKSFSQRYVIKILKNDSILTDCVQYKHYENWYENIFTKMQVEEELSMIENTPSLNFNVNNYERVLATK